MKKAILKKLINAVKKLSTPVGNKGSTHNHSSDNKTSESDIKSSSDSARRFFKHIAGLLSLFSSKFNRKTSLPIILTDEQQYRKHRNSIMSITLILIIGIFSWGLLSDGAYLFAQETEIVNTPPSPTFSLSKKKKADVVVSLGGLSDDRKSSLSDKVNTYITQKLKAHNVDANVTAVQTSSQNMQNSFNWIKDTSDSIGQISFLDGGSTIHMTGNTRLAGFNKIYTNVSDTGISKSVMSFSYNINYGDSFDAAGILINTSVDSTGNMNGYLLAFPHPGYRDGLEVYHITNWKSGEELYNGSYAARGTISSDARILADLDSGTSGDLEITSTKTTISISRNGSSIGTVDLPKHYGWGFGFCSDHYSHSCNQIGKFDLTNVKLQTTTGKSLSDVMTGLSWRDGASRFLSNISDKSIFSTDDDSTQPATSISNFDYTGSVQTYTAPVSGDYTFETWGAQGGSINSSSQGGLGGYSKGSITLDKGQTVYVYVGGKGNLSTSGGGGFNGGGDVNTSYSVKGNSSNPDNSGGGGGATDIRIGGTSLSNRKIVAGGGGGTSPNFYSTYGLGGYGGGSTGGSSTSGDWVFNQATGGTQSSGGTGGHSQPSYRDNDGQTITSGVDGTSGTLGNGGSCNAYASGGGGGGGYYGGGGGSGDADAYGHPGQAHSGGGGGSGYVGGVTSSQLLAGNQSFTSPSGTAETGHSGNGYARITSPQLDPKSTDFSLGSVKQIYTGNTSMWYVMNNGDVYVQGTTKASGLGNVSVFKDLTKVYSGTKYFWTDGNTSTVVTSDGYAYVTGGVEHDYFGLGNYTQSQETGWVRVPGTNIKKLLPCFKLTEDGNVYYSGDNWNGAAGIGTSGNGNFDYQYSNWVYSTNNVKDIASSYGNTSYILLNSGVAKWAGHSYSNWSDDSNHSSWQTLSTGISYITATNTSVAMITTSGNLLTNFTLDFNSSGFVSPTQSSSFHTVDTGVSNAYIDYDGIEYVKDGNLYVAGNNTNYTFGDGTATASAVPKVVASNVKVLGGAGIDDHTVYISDSNKLYVAGMDSTNYEFGEDYENNEFHSFKQVDIHQKASTNDNTTTDTQLSNEDKGKVAPIVQKLLSGHINFAGLGNDTNKAEYQAIVKGNDNYGTFIDNTNLDTALNAYGEYILSILNSQTSDSNIFLVGEEVDYGLKYADRENDSKMDEMWRYDHDDTKLTYKDDFIDASSGIPLDHSLGLLGSNKNWIKNSITSFSKPGTYVIRYKARDNPTGDSNFDNYNLWSGDDSCMTTITVHRKPLAIFRAYTTANASTGKFDTHLVYRNSDNSLMSYDPDHQTTDGTRKGIVNYKFAYKNINDSGWTDGAPPSSLPADNNYLIRMQVQDLEGQWSDPTVVNMTTSNDNLPPIAQFTLQTSEMGVGGTNSITDQSFDPNGDTMRYYWTVKDSTGKVYRDKVSSMPSKEFFEALPIGKYSITLVVDDGPVPSHDSNTVMKTSDPYTQELTIDPINNAPTANFYLKAPSDGKPQTSSQGFSYTGTAQSYTVPETGVYKLETWGAQGGTPILDNYEGNGGKGGYSSGKTTLTKGQILWVYSGGNGTNNSGFNGGGAGQGNAMYGGGASDIRTSKTDLSSRLIVAGGGGGGERGPGGVGGGIAGKTANTIWNSVGGGGGTQTAGGTAGYHSIYGKASPGEFGKGGDGKALAGTYTSSYQDNAGGGGGGYYGGGGSVYAGGGGGGSGYVGTLSNSITLDGEHQFLSPYNNEETGHAGDGYVRITKTASGITQPTSFDLDNTSTPIQVYGKDSTKINNFTDPNQFGTDPDSDPISLLHWFIVEPNGTRHDYIGTLPTSLESDNMTDEGNYTFGLSITDDPSARGSMLEPLESSVVTHTVFVKSNAKIVDDGDNKGLMITGISDPNYSTDYQKSAVYQKSIYPFSVYSEENKYSEYTSNFNGLLSKIVDTSTNVASPDIKKGYNIGYSLATTFNNNILYPYIKVYFSTTPPSSHDTSDSDIGANFNLSSTGDNTNLKGTLTEEDIKGDYTIPYIPTLDTNTTDAVAIPDTGVTSILDSDSYNPFLEMKFRKLKDSSDGKSTIWVANNGYFVPPLTVFSNSASGKVYVYGNIYARMKDAEGNIKNLLMADKVNLCQFDSSHSVLEDLQQKDNR